MKKITLFSLLSLFLIQNAAFSAEQTPRRFEASGEIVSADPLYSQVTIKHAAIKGFASDGATEFFVNSPELLKGLAKRDLVNFTVLEEKGDARIEKITKTGTAPIREKEAGVGQAVQDVFIATGEVAKTVTSPITPAHELVSGAVGATTDTTGSAFEETGPEMKSKF